MPTIAASLSFDALVDFDRSQCHQLSHEDFFSAIRWKGRSKKASKSVSATAEVLRKRLTKQFPTIHLLDSNERSIARWSSDVDSDQRSTALFDLLKFESDQTSGRESNGNGHTRKTNERNLSSSLNAILDDIIDISTASTVELIALAELLREPSSLNDADLVRLWRVLLVESLAYCAELPEPEGGSIPNDQRAMTTIEVPFQAALLFSDVKGASGVRKQAAATANVHLDSLTDTDGTPHGQLLRVFRNWLASLTRCTLWADWSASKLWSRESQERFKLVLNAAVAMTDGRGRLPFDEDVDLHGRSILSTACVRGWKRKSPVTRMIESWQGAESVVSAAKRPQPSKVDPSPTGQSDWAELAYLRSHWSADGDRIVVGHAEAMPIIDFACQGFPILSGDWSLDIRINGESLTEAGEWYNVCWFSDADSDYAELQWKVHDGLRIERQIFLSRKEQFGILSDCLTANESDAVEITSRIPLSSGTEHRILPRTRELILESDDVYVRMFPVALDHDRVQKATGTLEVCDAQLQWSQQGAGAIFSPVMIDWSKDRRDREAVWNRLTITDDRRVVSSAEAAAYRLRVGKSQWVIYRNHHTDGRHRAILGCHTTNETIIGRFNAKSGEVEPVVFVE